MPEFARIKWPVIMIVLMVLIAVAITIAGEL
jgi:hypothetical protein